jgi:chemotaxis receptor (MCP) glutamine deamidase CheD
MLELNSELREIYLDPGELHNAREPAIIRTVLGACGITCWSPKLRVGALCHLLLPYCPTDLTAESAWSRDADRWISRFGSLPGSSTSSMYLAEKYK